MGMSRLVYGIVLLLVADKVNCGVVPKPIHTNEEKHFADTPEKIHYVGKINEHPDKLSWFAKSSDGKDLVQGQTSLNPREGPTSKYSSSIITPAKSRKSFAASLPPMTRPQANSGETISARQTRPRLSTVHSMTARKTSISMPDPPQLRSFAQTLTSRKRTALFTVYPSTPVSEVSSISRAATTSGIPSAETISARRVTTKSTVKPATSVQTMTTTTVLTSATPPPIPSAETISARRRTTRSTVQPVPSVQTMTAKVSTVTTAITTPGIPSPATATSRPSHHGSHQLKHVIYILLAILIVVFGILIVLAYGKGYVFRRRLNSDKTPVYHELKNLHM